MKKTSTKTAVLEKPASGKPAAKSVKAATAKKASSTAKKAAPKQPSPSRIAAKAAESAVAPDLYHSLHALLHTMRVIEQHEEPLCSMQDELRRTGRLSATHRRRLQRLVDELPAADYQHDLETLRRAVAA